MDVKSLIERLKGELTCSICLDYFTDPVIVNCGHSFCRECLIQCRGDAGDTLTCPECRQFIQISDLVPSPSLQKLPIVGKSIIHLLQSMVVLATCDQHLEKEKFFCEEDQKFLCEYCSITQEHKDHRILPFGSAIAEGKEELQETKNMLLSKMEEVIFLLHTMKQRETLFKGDAYSYKELIKNEYRKIHQFLWAEESLHLKRLDEESRDNVAEAQEKKGKLAQQVQNLNQMILAVQDTLDNAPFEMVMDKKDILARKEKLLNQKSELSFPFWSTCPITGLREMLMSYHRDITLDSETAHPHLILSKDLKTVEYTRISRDVPDNENRFNPAVFVLGTQTFTSGKHYWEVKVEDNTEWSVGIFTDSVSRKGRISLSNKIRTLVGFKYRNNFFLWDSQHGFYESPPIHNLGIFLDYDEGHLTFYDVSDKSPIFSPLNLPFQGPLRPLFSPCCPNKKTIPEGPWSDQEMAIDSNNYGKLTIM